MIEEKLVHKQASEIERLIRDVETITEPVLREKIVTLVQSLLGFHAAGMERLMQIIAAEGKGSGSLQDKVAGDRLVSSLLLLYGVHPLSVEARVEQAVERLRSNPAFNACAVEVVGIADQVVRLQLAHDQQRCHSSKQMLRTAIEEALYEAAPDLDEIQFIDDVQQAPVHFVPLVSLRGDHGFRRTFNRTLPKP